MGEFSIALAAIGGMVLALGLISRLLEQSIFMEPLIALLLGVLLGPQALNLLDLSRWGMRQELILEYVARLTLGIGLVAVALRIPQGFPASHWRPLAVLLGLGMPLMWMSSSLLVYLIVDLPFLLALLIGAIITPTDPIVASSIVTGPVASENLPDRLKHTLSFESGANDGLTYLFVFLPLLFLAMPVEEAFSHWLTRTLLGEVGVAMLFGAVTGYVAGKLMVYAEQHNLMENPSLLAHTLALSLFVLGSAKLLHSNEILAVFVAGVVFDEVISRSDQARSERIQEAVNRFFSQPIFILVGTALPWQEWAALGWRGIALVIAVLLLRRLPFVLLLRPILSNLRGWGDALFVGWFGPVAIGALYYASFIQHRLGTDQVWTVTSLIICASVVVHGMTATPLSKLYGRWVKDRSRSGCAE